MKPGLLPRGACDVHAHIYGPASHYPAVSDAAYPPRPGTDLGAYRRMADELGLERVVVVQPTAYGTDHRCTLDAIAALDGRACGVAMVPLDASDAEFERLGKRGIRGLRFHLFAGGIHRLEMLEEAAARAAAHGWFLQIQLDGRQLAEVAPRIARAPGIKLVDHIGKFVEPVGVDDPSFLALLRLLDRGDVWIKIAAAYETSRSGSPDYSDVAGLAIALLRHAPERAVWGSNWPHAALPDRPPSDAALLDLLLRWAGDEALARRVLVDNPAMLYGFQP